MTAAALVAAVGDGRQFQSARHFAAWLGADAAHPGQRRQGAHRPDRKGGDRYLCTLLIHGARAVVSTTFRKDVVPRP